MPVDTFICGSCLASFNEIEQFVLHKNDHCGTRAGTAVTAELGDAGTLAMDGDGSQAGNTYTEDGSQEGDGAQSDVYMMNSSQILNTASPTVEQLELTDEQGNIIKCPTPSEILGSVSDSLLSGTLLEGQLLGDGQTVIILQGDYPHMNLEGATGQIVTEIAEDCYSTASTVTSGPTQKRRGRPRKSEQKKKVDVTFRSDPESNKPDIGKDGRLTCTRCKKTFLKQRVFNAHKCMANSDYVDFSHKEAPTIEPDDNHMPQDDIDDCGAVDSDTEDTDYKLPRQVKLQQESSDSSDSSGQPTVDILLEAAATATDADQLTTTNTLVTPMANSSLQLECVEEGGPGASDTQLGQPDPTNPNPVATDGDGEVGAGQNQNTSDSGVTDNQNRLRNVEVEADPDVNSSHTAKPTDGIDSVPVFHTEQERLEFEQSLNIDLSGVDSMFRVHCIEQDLNEYATPSSRLLSNQLSLYSCNTCDKVFKTLSHMRFHCLTHTDLKPFLCPRCPYSSNVRGNLYTHMRKHTGQFYKCDKCKFKTVNKTHLLEHENIHSNVRHICSICKKTYNTLKSLVNHVRKYHTSRKGKEYLATFMSGREIKGSTIIHQCHVCNRKFKKKMDRDRHLFVHDIKDIPSIQHCELCDYTACRPKYLEKHFQKHRCIYRCCKCEEQFLSSLRLIDHVTAAHMQEKGPGDCDLLFEECINSSLYLPEPDEVMSPEEKELVNLPPELSRTAQSEKLLSIGSDMAIADVDTAGDEFINKVPRESEPVSQDESRTTPPLGESVVMDMSDITGKAGGDTPANPAAQGTADSVMDMDTEGHADDAGEHETGSGNGGQDEVASEEKCCDDVVKGDNEQNGAIDKHVLSDRSMLAACVESESDSLGPEFNLNNRQEDSNLINEDNTADNHEDTADAQEGTTRGEKSVRGEELMDRLGYLPLSMQIFQKMRETFGSEECEYCGRLYFNQTDYETHVRTHTGEKPHMCQQCGYSAITKDNLKRHIDKEHMHITYQCKECSYRASSRTQLWNHQLKHRGLKGLVCPECNEPFESMKDLRIHATRVHPDCNRDEIEKITNTSFKHKMQGKMGKGYFRPARCPYDATQRSHLKRHMETHNVLKRFACRHCDYSANTLGYLKIHYTRFHKDVNINSVPQIGTQPVEVQTQSDNNVFKCLSCDYLFGNLSDLKRHLKLRHLVRVEELQSVTYVGSESEVSEFQVVQEEDGAAATAVVGYNPGQPRLETNMQVIEHDGTESMDEKTASAVNILQQIINQGGLGQSTANGSILSIDSSDVQQIIVQAGDGMVVTNGDTDGDGNEYVIEYVTPQEDQAELSLVEVPASTDTHYLTAGRDALELEVGQMEVETST